MPMYQDKLLNFIECDPSCSECIGGTSSECNRCEFGKYLLMDGGSKDISYGSCDFKTLTDGAFTLFVSAPSSNNYDA